MQVEIFTPVEMSMAIAEVARGKTKCAEPTAIRARKEGGSERYRERGTKRG